MRGNHYVRVMTFTMGGRQPRSGQTASIPEARYASVERHMRFRTAPWTPMLALVGGLAVAAFLSGIHLQALLAATREQGRAPALPHRMAVASEQSLHPVVAAGLALSMLGDLLLEIHEALFLHGLGAFLLAHVAYIAAYLTATRTPRWGLGVPFLLLGTGLWLFLAPRLGALGPPVGLYIAVICTMMWRAAALMGEEGLARRERSAPLLGALCFGLSDTLLAFRLFVHPVAGISSPPSCCTGPDSSASRSRPCRARGAAW